MYAGDCLQDVNKMKKLIVRAAEAEYVVSVEMPKLRADQRGQDLSPEEIDRAGASIKVYKVCECGLWVLE